MRTVRIPDAANIGERLEAVEWDAALGECLGHSKAASARADDTVTLHRPSLFPHLAKRRSGPFGRPARVRPKHQGRRRSTHSHRPPASLICVNSFPAQNQLYATIAAQP